MNNESEKYPGRFRRRVAGFTLIEILMVLVLIAILAALGITQFTDFSAEAKNSTVKSNLRIIRNAISRQYAQERLRCGVSTSAWPPQTNIAANDITNGGAPCTTTQVPNASDRVFVVGGIPVNSWGPGPTNTVGICSTAAGNACTNHNFECATGGARGAASDGWCYNVLTGEFWANTSNNGGATVEYAF